MNPNTIVDRAYIVSGMSQILLAPDKNPGWKSLHNSYAKIREEIKNSNADLILYYSTQWFSVIGHLFQGDPNPEWVYVDQNWYDFGSIPYKFKIDSDFAKAYADEMRKTGKNSAVVNYRGFPIDGGTIVAQKLMNPDNRLPAGIVSCNIYAEKAETMQFGEAGAVALARQGKKAIVVLVSNFSNRFHVKDIPYDQDRISSLKDDEWNRKMLELLSAGCLEDCAEVAREFSREANGDMGMKGLWWLNALCGKHNEFEGTVFDYQPVWGAGAALVGLKPLIPIRPPKTWAGESVSHHSKSAAAKTVKSSDGKISTDKAPAPVGAYPHARREGNLLFLSGVGPRKPGTDKIPGVTMDAKGNVLEHDIEAQTLSVIENVKIILEEAGSRLEDVIDVQVFLTNMKRDFQKYNKIYADHFSNIGATRTTLEVGSLPTPIAVEFKVIAKIGDSPASNEVEAKKAEVIEGPRRKGALEKFVGEESFL